MSSSRCGIVLIGIRSFIVKLLTMEYLATASMDERTLLPSECTTINDGGRGRRVGGPLHTVLVGVVLV
jgi:hypothetical protein